MTVANLTTLTANINRDSKRVKVPYKITDFCFWAGSKDRNDPDAENAAAYMKILADGQLPGWAYFVFNEMQGLDAGVTAPEPVAAIGEGVLLLAPRQKNGGLEGLLLATHAAAGRKVPVKIAGFKATISVPEFDEQVIAREDCFVATV